MTHQEQLAARVEELASDLRDARAEIAALRERRASAFSIPATAIVMAVTIAGVGSWRLQAQGGGTPAKVVAPFEVVNSAGQTLLKVESGTSGKGVLYVGAPGGGGAWIGTGSSGSGFLQITRADGKEAASIGQVQNGPMAIRFAGSDGATTVAQLGLDSGGRGLLSVGDEKAGGIFAGAGSSGAGFVNIRRSDGKDGATIGQLQGGPLALRIMAADGQAAASIGLDDAGRGMLQVGLSSGGGTTLGVGKSGAGFAIVRTSTGQDGISLGQLAGGSLAVRLFDGAKVVGEVGLDATGHSGALTLSDSTARPFFRAAEKVSAADARVTVGDHGGAYSLAVANAAGTSVAVIGEAKIGGGVMAVNNAAGTIRAIVSGTGQIHVAGESGQTLATMVADKGEGAFSVRNTAGTTIARLGQGSAGGLLQLADMAGNAMVEGGVLSDGRGLVRAFPVGNPGAGLVGLPGTFILGRK